MHQLGLLRIVRLALVFVAFVVAAAQVFSFVSTSSAADALAAPGLEDRWPVVAAMPPVNALGVVMFDGAASGGLELGAAQPVNEAVDAGGKTARATLLR
ncbi:MAG: hypothetical protein AAF416_14240 [Pseudomonadota bacterium]